MFDRIEAVFQVLYLVNLVEFSIELVLVMKLIECRMESDFVLMVGLPELVNLFDRQQQDQKKE